MSCINHVVGQEKYKDYDEIPIRTKEEIEKAKAEYEEYHKIYEAQVERDRKNFERMINEMTPMEAYKYGRECMLDDWD